MFEKDELAEIVEKIILQRLFHCLLIGAIVCTEEIPWLKFTSLGKGYKTLMDCLIACHFLYTVFLFEKSRLASSSEQACNIKSDSKLGPNGLKNMVLWPGRGDHGWSYEQAAQGWSSCHSPPARDECTLFTIITKYMDHLPCEYGAGVTEDSHELQVGFGERQSRRHTANTRLNPSLLELWWLNLLKHASFTLVSAGLRCHLPGKFLNWYVKAGQRACLFLADTAVEGEEGGVWNVGGEFGGEGKVAREIGLGFTSLEGWLYGLQG